MFCSQKNRFLFSYQAPAGLKGCYGQKWANFCVNKKYLVEKSIQGPHKSFFLFPELCAHVNEAIWDDTN